MNLHVLDLEATGNARREVVGVAVEVDAPRDGGAVARSGEGVEAEAEVVEEGTVVMCGGVLDHGGVLHRIGIDAGAPEIDVPRPADAPAAGARRADAADAPQGAVGTLLGTRSGNLKGNEKGKRKRNERGRKRNGRKRRCWNVRKSGN